jgi:hypothetical protein
MVLYIPPTNLAKVYLKIMRNYGNSFLKEKQKKAPEPHPRLEGSEAAESNENCNTNLDRYYGSSRCLTA